MWRETLGLYCALDGPDGDAALVFARVASYLHPPRFAAILEDFVERATIWRACTRPLRRQRRTAACSGGQHSSAPDRRNYERGMAMEFSKLTLAKVFDAARSKNLGDPGRSIRMEKKADGKLEIGTWSAGKGHDWNPLKGYLQKKH